LFPKFLDSFLTLLDFACNLPFRSVGANMSDFPASEKQCLAKLAEEMGIEQRLESGRVKETRNYGAKDSFQYASKRPWLVLLYLSVDISESCWDLAYAFILIYHTIAFTQFSVVKTGHLYESKLWYPSVAIQIYDQNINGRSRDGHLL
jgi:hypothetical protein